MGARRWALPKLARGEYPAATAWCTIMRETTLDAADTHYDDASKLVPTLQAESDSAPSQNRLAMCDLCQRLHCVPIADTERGAWSWALAGRRTGRQPP